MASLRISLAVFTCLVALTAGCGTQPFGATDPYGYGDPYGNGSYGSDPYGGGYGGGDPYGGGASYGGGVSYGGGYGSTPGNLAGGFYNTVPTPAPFTGQLQVGRVSKDAKGMLFWKKLTISGQVSNPSQGVLSGELQVSFTKKGKVVETQTEFVTDLAPGQSHGFTITSKKAADDVQVTVSSMAGQPVGGSLGGSYGGGSFGGGSYGGGSYGSGAYGGSSGTGYGNVPY